MAARSSVETPSSEYTSSSSRSHSSCSGSCSCRRRENSPRSHNDGPKGDPICKCSVRRIVLMSVFLILLGLWTFFCLRWIFEFESRVRFKNATIAKVVQKDLCVLMFPLMLSTDLPDEIKTQLYKWMCSANFVEGLLGRQVSPQRVDLCRNMGITIAPYILQYFEGIIAVENWCNSTLRMSCSGFLSLDLSIHSASSTPTWGKQLLGLTHSWWLVESMRNYHLSPRSHWWHDRESDVGPKLLISLDSAIVLAYLNYLSNNNTNNDALLMREAFLKAVIGAPLILKRAPSSLHKTWEDRELWAFRQLFPEDAIAGSHRSLKSVPPPTEWIQMSQLAFYWAVRVESFCSPRKPARLSDQTLEAQKILYLKQLKYLLTKLDVHWSYELRWSSVSTIIDNHTTTSY